MSTSYEAAKSAVRDCRSQASSAIPVDAILRAEKLILDASVQDSARNDSYVAGSIRNSVDAVVGGKFKLTCKPAFAFLGLTKEWADTFKVEAEEAFNLWANSSNNEIDASGHTNLTGLVRQAQASYGVHGEVIAVVEWKQSSHRAYKTSIQVIDPKRLSTPGTEYLSDRVIDGVKVDRYGEPIGYYIQSYKPGSITTVALNKHKYVKARKPWGRKQVIHLYESDRPGQHRGISAIVTALREISMMRKFRVSTIESVVLSSLVAGTLESEIPTDLIASQIGMAVENGTGSTTPSDVVTDYATGVLESTKALGTAEDISVNGARIVSIMPGTKLALSRVGDSGVLGQDFEKSLLRYLAAATGQSYEQISKDYNNVSFASARVAMLETAKRVMADKSIIADPFATAIYRLWLEEWINMGHNKTPVPNIKGPQVLDALSRCSWTGASFGQVDPMKETKGAIDRMQYGISTQERECAKLGLDWQEVNEQAEREKNDREARGIEWPDKSAQGDNNDKIGFEEDKKDEKDEKDKKDDKNKK